MKSQNPKSQNREVVFNECDLPSMETKSKTLYHWYSPYRWLSSIGSACWSAKDQCKLNVNNVIGKRTAGEHIGAIVGDDVGAVVDAFNTSVTQKCVGELIGI